VAGPHAVPASPLPGAADASKPKKVEAASLGNSARLPPQAASLLYKGADVLPWIQRQ